MEFVQFHEEVTLVIEQPRSSPFIKFGGKENTYCALPRLATAVVNLQPQGLRQRCILLSENLQLTLVWFLRALSWFTYENTVGERRVLQVGEPGKHVPPGRKVHSPAEVDIVLLPVGGQFVLVSPLGEDLEARHADPREVQLKKQQCLNNNLFV